MKEEKRNSVRDQLILDHIHMVKIIALKISARLPPHIELDDLVHSGVLGLIDAAGKFDAQKGIKFSTYASLRIKGAIMDDLRQMDWATRSQRQKIKDLERLTIELGNRMGHPPSEEELAKEMNVDLVELHRLMEESRGFGLGVFRYQENQEGQIGDERILAYSSEENTPDPGHQLMEEELKAALTEMVEQLPQREKMVISLYYQDELNLKEIGKIMDLTESRISQIRSLALARIRSRLEQMTETGPKTRQANL
jgi:RNA polymerase sigma factor for flagellar operon FliA